MYMDAKELEKVSNFTLKFGKFKGKKFSEVDKDYLQWCLDKEVFDNDKYKWNSMIREYIKNLLVD